MTTSEHDQLDLKDRLLIQVLERIARQLERIADDVIGDGK